MARIPTTKFELKQLLQECLAANERHERIVHTRKQDIARQTDLHQNQLASLPRGVISQVQDTMARELASKRAEIVKNSEAERTAPLKELNAAREAVAGSKKFMGNSRQLIQSYALGSPERLAVFQELQSLANSPAALRTLVARVQAEAQIAEREHISRITAAVLIGIIDNLPADARAGIDTAELATAVMGDEASQIRSLIQEIELCFDSAINRDRALISGKENMVKRVEEALARQAIKHPSSDDDERSEAA